MTYTSLPNRNDLQAIAAKIKEVLSEQTGMSPASIHLEDDLLVDLGLDSLAIAELMMLLERHLQRQVPVDDLMYITTVADLASLLATSETSSAGECRRRPTQEMAGRVCNAPAT